MLEGIIVGFGNMGKTHLIKYREIDVKIISVVEPDLTRANEARSLGMRVYQDIDDISAGLQIEFIDICTPTYLHFQHLQQSLRLKRPIFVEKPLVRTIEEVKWLRSHYQDFGLPIFVGEVEQYNDNLRGFLEYKGRPKLILISREVNLDFFLKGAKSWFLDDQLSGGIVLDLMNHDINLLVAKYGVPVIEQVVGLKKKYQTIDEVEAKLKFDDFNAILRSSWIAENKDKPIKVEMVIQQDNGEEVRIVCDSYDVLGANSGVDPFRREIQSFIETVKSGKTPYDLGIYLDGVTVALEISSKMRLR